MKVSKFTFLVNPSLIHRFYRAESSSVANMSDQAQYCTLEVASAYYQPKKQVGASRRSPSTDGVPNQEHPQSHWRPQWWNLSRETRQGYGLRNKDYVDFLHHSCAGMVGNNRHSSRKSGSQSSTAKTSSLSKAQPTTTSTPVSADILNNRINFNELDRFG